MKTNEHNERDDVIEVTDLRRVYGGDFEAVRGITFSVGHGELFALLGTNGAARPARSSSSKASRPRQTGGCGSSGTIRTRSGRSYGPGSA